MLLTNAELVELTRMRRQAAQRRVLDAIGVPYRMRPDGSLVVLRAAVDLALGGVPVERPGRPAPELQLPAPRTKGRPRTH
jgi:hypothetical protein